jgi:site-specific DNA-methyltransferase (cytosine-N4-specific)
MGSRGLSSPCVYHSTDTGQIILGDSLQVMRVLPARSVDLVVTSPPFGLVRKKEYGNVDADCYVGWFRPFAEEVRRILKARGSFVMDIGGAWNSGVPTRHLYHFKLLVALCEDFGFQLAQEFYWWNPSKLPTPAEWVTVRRARVKDAVNCVWWLSASPWPKASNRRVLQPYSDSMRELLRSGYRAMKRPSGHEISTKFGNDNSASIPPNLIAIPNTESNSQYLTYCREHHLKVHPARFPAELPEYFIRMLTDRGDSVLDPFAGSCVTGEVCERLKRKWTCVELVEEYLEGALARFQSNGTDGSGNGREPPDRSGKYYRIPHPAALWNGNTTDRLPADGGQTRGGGGKPSRKAPRGSRR